MKFNDREIAVKGIRGVDHEGVLQYLRPQSNDWANWYSQPSYKERKFKLVSNLLFYYRMDESEPLGVLVLENCTIRQEKPFNGAAFPFSIEFADESDRKHIFSCISQSDVDKWVDKLKCASYEYWRTQLNILQKKISMRTGKDPMSAYVGNQCGAAQLDWYKLKSVGPEKSSFRCHVESSSHLCNSENKTETQDLIQF